MVKNIDVASMFHQEGQVLVEFRPLVGEYQVHEGGYVLELELFGLKEFVQMLGGDSLAQ